MFPCAERSWVNQAGWENPAPKHTSGKHSSREGEKCNSPNAPAAYTFPFLSKYNDQAQKLLKKNTFTVE